MTLEFWAQLGPDDFLGPQEHCSVRELCTAPWSCNTPLATLAVWADGLGKKRSRR